MRKATAKSSWRSAPPLLPLFALPLFLCAFAAPRAEAAAQAAQVRVAVDAAFDIARAPLCLAIKKGWFEAEKIEVTIIESRGSGSRLSAVAGARADIAWATAAEILSERARAMKLKIVGALGDLHPACVFFLADTGISSPGDLAGKRIAVRPLSIETVLLPLMAEKSGIRIEDLILVPLDPAAAIAALASGSVQAMLGSLEELAILERAFAPASLGHILWAVHGFDIYGECYVARDAAVTGNSAKSLAAFLGVIYKAWEYSLSNPEEAAAAAAELLLVEPEIVSQGLARWVELYATDAYRTLGIGSIDRARIAETMHATATLLGSAITFRTEDAYNGALLPSPPVRMKEKEPEAAAPTGPATVPAALAPAGPPAQPAP